jgi:hypothetical protein
MISTQSVWARAWGLQNELKGAGQLNQSIFVTRHLFSCAKRGARCGKKGTAGMNYPYNLIQLHQPNQLNQLSQLSQPINVINQSTNYHP